MAEQGTEHIVDRLHFQLISPRATHASEQLAMVVVPGLEGEFAALTRHAPFVAQLKEGEVRLYNSSMNQEKPDATFQITGGFAEVTPSGCTVLADEVVEG